MKERYEGENEGENEGEDGGEDGGEDEGRLYEGQGHIYNVACLSCFAIADDDDFIMNAEAPLELKIRQSTATTISE